MQPWPLTSPLCCSTGHVTHGWRSYPGSSQLQHRGLCWPWHVPALLWVTCPPPPLSSHHHPLFLPGFSFFHCSSQNWPNVCSHLSSCHRFFFFLHWVRSFKMIFSRRLKTISCSEKCWIVQKEMRKLPSNYQKRKRRRKCWSQQNWKHRQTVNVEPPRTHRTEETVAVWGINTGINV